MEPMTFSYEETLPNFGISGDASIFEGPLPTPPIDTVDLTDSTRVVRTGQDWWVLLRWECTGWLNWIMAGNFYCKVYLEQMGKDEFELMPPPYPADGVEVPFVAEDPHTYIRDIPFPLTSIAVPAGLYKVTASLTFKGPLPRRVPAPIAAIAEGPVLQFYDVGP